MQPPTFNLSDAMPLSASPCIDLRDMVGILDHQRPFVDSDQLMSSPRTLFVSGAGLEEAKRTIVAYRQGRIQSLTPEVWKAKKIVDSTLHPGTFSGP